MNNGTSESDDLNQKMLDSLDKSFKFEFDERLHIVKIWCCHPNGQNLMSKQFQRFVLNLEDDFC